MTDHWRGDPEEQTGMQRWWRHRWAEGSIYVLDVDRLVAPSSLEKGLLVEEKHIAADDKTWRVTRELAHRLGWGSALFEYDTNNGRHNGDVTRIWATVKLPGGMPLKQRAELDCEKFDAWVCQIMGARPCA